MFNNIVFSSYTLGKTGTDGSKKPNQEFNFERLEEAVAYSRRNKYDIVLGRIKPGFCLIDCDDDSSVNAMDKIINYLGLTPFIVQTNRGKHYYFKLKNSGNYKCVNGVINAYGIKYDIKTGNSKKTLNGHTGTTLGIIFQNGEWRDILSKPDEISIIPKALLAKLKVGKQHVTPSYEIEDRNDVLFTQYRPAFIKSKFSQTEAIEFVETIQKVGLLKSGDKEALTPEEIKTIMREPWELGGPGKTDEKECDVAKRLIEENNIIEVGSDRQMTALYRYNGKYYEAIYKSDVERIIYKDNKWRSTRMKTDIYKCFETEDKKHYDSKDLKHVSFKNGLLNLDTYELIEHAEEIPCTVYFDFNYYPPSHFEGGYNKLLWETLYKWADNDKDLIELILEMVGCTIGYRNLNRASFFISGDGCNGKTTFMNFLRFVLGGRRNVSEIDLTSLGKKFHKIQIKDKIANIYDDAEFGKLSKSAESAFKIISSNGYVTDSFKGKDLISFDTHATMIFTCNDIPTITDFTGATSDRMVHIPLRHKFTEDDIVSDLDEQLCTDEIAEEFLSYAIERYKNAKNRKNFTKCSAGEEVKHEHLLSSSNILAFCDDYLANHSNMNNTFAGSDVNSMYESYVDYCDREHEVDICTKSMFTRKINSHYNLKTIKTSRDGTRVQLFKSKDET